MTSRSRDALRPRFASWFTLLEKRGRRECRVPNAPTASRAKLSEAHERSHHRYTGVNPAFPAQWFYGFLRALPGDQACLTPSPALLLADLTPASGRQNHTTSPSAAAHFVKRAARVHRIPPRVRDVRTPLCGTGWRAYNFDLGQARTELFLQMGLDSPNHVDPVQQIRLNAHAVIRRARLGEAVIRHTHRNN